MSNRWAFTELRERTLELVTNTLNVKHPSLEFIGNGLTEVMFSVVLTKHSQSS